MGKKKNQAERDSIGWDRNYYWGKVVWANQRIDKCGQEMERLSSAINALKDYQDDLRDGWNAVKNIPFRTVRWKGDNADKFFDSCSEDGDIHTEYTSRIDDIDELIETIQTSYNTIKRNQDSAQGVLEDFSPLYNDANYRYENYWLI